MGTGFDDLNVNACSFTVSDARDEHKLYLEMNQAALFLKKVQVFPLMAVNTYFA